VNNMTNDWMKHARNKLRSVSKDCICRQALELHPVDFNGLADPYLVIRCGNQKVNDKENKILNDLNPVFGR